MKQIIYFNLNSPGPYCQIWYCHPLSVHCRPSAARFSYFEPVYQMEKNFAEAGPAAGIIIFVPFGCLHPDRDKNAFFLTEMSNLLSENTCDRNVT